MGDDHGGWPRRLLSNRWKDKHQMTISHSAIRHDRPPARPELLSKAKAWGGHSHYDLRALDAHARQH